MATTSAQVSAGADDGNIFNGSTFGNNQASLRVGENSSADPYSVFLRMQLDDVGQGDTINSATLSLVGANDGAGPNATFDIYAEDSDNPAAPTTYADFTGRTRTTATTRVFEETSDDGTTHDYDVKSIVQEIVNRAGWSAGNYIIFFLDADVATTGNNDRVEFDSYDGVVANAASLDVDYTASGGGTTVDCAGSIEGPGALESSVSAQKNISAGLKSDGSPQAQLKPVRALSGNVSGFSLLTALIKTDRSLSGSIDSGSVYDAILKLERKLAASVLAVGDLSGLPKLEKLLSADLSGNGKVVGQLATGNIITLAGTVSSRSSFISSWKRFVRLDATIKSASDLSAALKFDKRLSGSLIAIADTSGQIATGNIVSLVGSLVSSADKSGSLKKAVSLSGDVDSAALLSAALKKIAKVSGSILSAGQLTSQLKADKSLAGQISSVSEIVEILGSLAGDAFVEILTIKTPVSTTITLLVPVDVVLTIKTPVTTTLRLNTPVII
jgi:hypothetical protein